MNILKVNGFNTQQMQYKVINFESCNFVAKELQKLLDKYEEQGYEYVNHEYTDKIIPGRKGFLGIGATKDIVEHVGFVVLRKKNEKIKDED